MVFDADGSVRSQAYREFEQYFPRPGWVEHDADTLWELTREVAHVALDRAGIDGRGLSAIGITNQRETVVAWDRASGRPLHRALVWQDRRTADLCQSLREAGHEPLFRERTGLVLDPYFSGTKLRWLLDNGVTGSACFGTVDSWLLFKLTGRHATDYSNASRTLLFDIHKLQWDPELCELLGVPISSLPEVLPNAYIYGTTTEFGGQVPVAGMAGDQQAALFGQACHEAGLGKNTYGTGSFVLQNAGQSSPDCKRGLLSTIAWNIEGHTDYAYEASIFVTGAAVQWLRDGIAVIDSAEQTAELAGGLESNEGVYFVPALTGLGSPHWDPHARGAIVGLTRGTGKAHLARAALESIAYQTVDAVRATEAASGMQMRELKADGGASVNSWLMQFQADVLGVPVLVPNIAETTALGASYLAGVAVGLWSQSDVASMWQAARRYEPEMSEIEREDLHGRWLRALAQVRGISAGNEHGDGG
jgi:glycerol kinase